MRPPLRCGVWRPVAWRCVNGSTIADVRANLARLAGRRGRGPRGRATMASSHRFRAHRLFIGDLADADVSPPSSPTSRARPRRGSGPRHSVSPFGTAPGTPRRSSTGTAGPRPYRKGAHLFGGLDRPVHSWRLPTRDTTISTASGWRRSSASRHRVPEPARGGVAGRVRHTDRQHGAPGRFGQRARQSRCGRSRIRDACRLRQPHRHGRAPPAYLGRSVIAAPTAPRAEPVPDEEAPSSSSSTPRSFDRGRHAAHPIDRRPLGAAPTTDT